MERKFARSDLELGGSYHRAGSCGAGGQAGMLEIMAIRPETSRPRIPQWRLRRSRKGTTFEMLTRVVEFLKALNG
jgi:hypothetical protein